jgi:hypothetical protein
VPFLETFGGFMQHCGILAMGGPSPKDTHPSAWRVPQCPHRTSVSAAGEDERGAFSLVWAYRHTVAFSASYLAEPLVKLYAGSTVFEIEMTVTNLKASRWSHVPDAYQLQTGRSCPAGV